MKTEIKVETLVQRTTGGPVMLVVEVYPSLDGTSLARCVWPEDQSLRSCKVEIDVLQVRTMPQYWLK